MPDTTRETIMVRANRPRRRVYKIRAQEEILEQIEYLKAYYNTPDGKEAKAQVYALEWVLSIVSGYRF
jgi:elongation factor P hydroxylase